ncbi:1,4-dihydroxy-2-naphthoate polyprenyltransferase [Acidipropionibacterium jensenii]|uniref:1,4-dihydroxy-2-naphthoate polyprenyltransferase n=1 Tax=Acidipropionibacterium jensenii TaxID=1749 RepID=UPI00264A3583|nr:1,4-dihydroxy-2-naphthoate polyprenyltransferase [Acidipropionibacterium jensenii]MDN5976521.1 1,4-dihydroxy-2-naphthoate polyprenyltransferase [Acidipropionibacterium jensenii]MDN5995086.1 1,4-dihydroxy-2-naphthoate polyprenyltransferase [Acidipropionibacterium jensenii]MDN6425994.1 1,4-dihydroxy-2-naphthoate polyprenyltransferase [Acidipropionibacterium jensenii]MDN6440589.1 1,4-dihydroxy-2-naphthoate polyprenyltransferase [Acidipropionibacterium jensenii]MDN6480485.1 1,4-dihydroxy-2-naph
MATFGQWVEGARLRTLPIAISSVIGGTAAAVSIGQLRIATAVLALVVALALVVGVNFANDYSDGIRGSDGPDRVGPLRLVGSGAARPEQVRAAAFGCFGVAGLAGLAVVVLTGQWWLLVLGIACVLAAWFYTGGSHPYGYAGLGEIFVFVFFGLVAVGGTTYVVAGRVDAAGWVTAVVLGLLACGVLVANNLRDIDGDRVSGKRTLATRLGHTGTRALYLTLVGLACLGVVAVTALTTWWALLGLAMVIFLSGPVRAMVTGASGMVLVRALRDTGFADLACSIGLLIGALLG